VSRAAIAVLLLAVACTGRGPSRGGAVAITAQLALRPAADGTPWVRDIADQMAPDPEIEVTPNPIYSDHAPPVAARTIRAAHREDLQRAYARARSQFNPQSDYTAVYEQDAQGWQLHFVWTFHGFELSPGAMAKVAAPRPEEEEFGVEIFLADGDAHLFEQLTRDYLDRRVALVSGDEALMIPVVRDVIPGGTLWITPGDDETADQVLARIVR
jgi:hypothetical protein